MRERHRLVIEIRLASIQIDDATRGKRHQERCPFEWRIRVELVDEKIRVATERPLRRQGRACVRRNVRPRVRHLDDDRRLGNIPIGLDDRERRQLHHRARYHYICRGQAGDV